MIKFTLKMIGTSALVLGIAATGVQLPQPHSDSALVKGAVTTWNTLATNANSFFRQHDEEIKELTVKGVSSAMDTATHAIEELGEFTEENRDEIKSKSEEMAESAVNFYFKEKVQ